MIFLSVLISIFIFHFFNIANAEPFDDKLFRADFAFDTVTLNVELAPRNFNLHPRSALIELLEKCLRREIRNLDAWPRFELPSAGERLTFVRDGVKLNRYFGTVVTPDAPYPVFSVSSDNNPYASLVYRQKYQEDKVNKVIDNSGELVFEFFPCCRWNATTAPPPLSVGDEYRTLKYDFSDSFDKLVLEFSNPMQDGSTKAMRTTKIGNGLVVDGDLATSTTMRLMDFQPQYFNGITSALSLAPATSLWVMDIYDAKYEAKDQLRFRSESGDRSFDISFELHLQYASLDQANDGRTALSGSFGFDVSRGDDGVGDMFTLGEIGNKMRDLGIILARECLGDRLED